MYNLSFAVRASGGEPSALTQTVRAAVLAVDRNQPFSTSNRCGRSWPIRSRSDGWRCSC